MVIFKKKCRQRTNYDTMDEVANAFMQDMYKICPACRAMPAPFQIPAKQESPSPKSEPKDDGFFGFVEGGGIDINILEKYNFK
eukprot:274114-Pyramimonas_sp.AAC.1